MNNSIDSLWHHYSETRFLLTQSLSCQLSFAIISAHNPLGTLLTPCQNRLLDRQLQSEIEKLHRPYRALVGAAADLTHMEKSWAVFIDRELAVELGRRFNQNAIYYVEQGRLSLLPCIAARDELKLGSFTERVKLVTELPELNG
ncbi:DUF3293 domain-containing protein [Shewanella salipaludis]|uniref:DUF3293 domain-containing protein n=1 Tax=Shewanella salipaludis TaxID=2723052 RepID=A0A972JL94_9GAMM|nr:DUF3293 domain-containing protein [Shewanella salipaludis]NMH65949.1 DUF3293 domain-containing protein [Shewanella salipaludis]